jgi:hypothetical protein
VAGVAGPAPAIQAPPPVGPSAGAAAGGCRPGPELEPRDYAQAEYIGRPDGAVARMCFHRSDGRSTSDSLNFHANGHVVMTTSAAAGGVASLGTMRGTYGFQEGGRLALRLAYAGTGVSQSTLSAGPVRSLDVAGQQALEQPRILPNCQRIAVRDVVRSVQWPPSPGHPSHIVIDGVRWEQMRVDCPAWQGWR